MLELSVNMLGFVWFEGDTVAAVHRHPQDRRTISLAGTSCTSGVVSGRNAASMAQRAICASSKPSDDLSSSLFLRFDFEWSNFATAITDGGILKAIVNSVIITLCSTVITCLVGAAAAYPLARRQTRGNKLVSAGILAIMMIPPLSILVPLYSFLMQIGGVNSYWGIVLVLSTTNLPLAIFLYTAFIRAIPASIDEAGMVDGASKPKIFFTLILPLLKPVTATVVIMTSVGVWNEYALSNYLITDASMQPIAPRVASFFASNSNNLGVGAAAALMAALPIVVLYLFLQRYFIDFTGRHENERQPQRHRVADGTWVREFRRGKPSFEGTALIAGTEGFCFGSGSMLGVQPAWSGSCSTTAGSMPAARIPPDLATGGSTAASGRMA